MSPKIELAPMITFHRVFTSLLVAPMLAATTALAGPPVAPVASTQKYLSLQWLDLRDASAQSAPYRRLWADRLSEAQKAWESGASLTGRRNSAAVPAYTLSRLFPDGTLASVLFDLYDCELPGNGSGADLYARCPLKLIARGVNGITTTKTIPRVCMLYVPPPRTPDGGPDPLANFTQARILGSKLQWQVIQAGRPVPACTMELSLT